MPSFSKLNYVFSIRHVNFSLFLTKIFACRNRLKHSLCGRYAKWSDVFDSTKCTRKVEWKVRKELRFYCAIHWLYWFKIL